ncbi:MULTISPECIES: 3'-5' exonuclease [Anaerolinea]|uniref:3'-5' exonuclease n=1 Tax=Anaerolinea TaxID=233189 RepID=UPI00262BD822|nr:3'-5' exonuclease [Anaerolinea thermophila]
MSTTVTPTLRQRAIQIAREVLKHNPIYLDTETTGLGAQDEIIEISIVNDQGQVVYESLVRPTRPIPPDAIAIHGITNEEVQKARPWHIVWQEVRPVLLNAGVVVIYNEEFDLRMMQQTHARLGLPWRDRFRTFDLMKLYAEYYGEWDPKRRSYRYHSLEAAGKQCGIALPNAHRATADTLLTRALLHFIAGVPY